MPLAHKCVCIMLLVCHPHMCIVQCACMCICVIRAVRYTIYIPIYGNDLVLVQFSFSLQRMSSESHSKTTIADLNNDCMFEVFSHFDGDDMCAPFKELPRVCFRRTQNQKLHLTEEHLDAHHHFFAFLENLWRHCPQTWCQKKIRNGCSYDSNMQWLCHTFLSSHVQILWRHVAREEDDVVALLKFNPQLRGLRVSNRIFCMSRETLKHLATYTSSTIEKLYLCPQKGRIFRMLDTKLNSLELDIERLFE